MSDTPRRIQRSRAKGWRMPEGAVYVGRPTRWGNPFGGALAAERYHRWISGEMSAFEAAAKMDWPCAPTRRLLIRLEALLFLRGKHLVCWCRLDQACHADVLLEIANRPLRCETPDA
jgi:hypothetical protein